MNIQRSVLIVLVYILCSCNATPKSNISGIDLSLEEMNKEITLSAPPEINTFFIGDNIRLVLLNTSTEQINFNQDYGVKIFSRQNEEWISIQNTIENSPNTKILLPDIGQMFPHIVIVIHPEIASEIAVLIRVFVIGNKNNTSTEVGAYIDINLNVN